jgi:hypothetical protein
LEKLLSASRFIAGQGGDLEPTTTAVVAPKPGQSPE